MRISPLTRLITSAFAVRDFWGGVLRVVGVLVAICVAAEVSGYLLRGRWSERPIVTVAQTVLTSIPFIALVFYVVTRLDQLQAALRTAATEDWLTRLCNRQSFFERSSAAHRAAGRGVLLMLDADFFKRVNDQHGHAAGDKTLRSLSRRMRSMMREGDVVGRLGGEEFAIYLPGATLVEGLKVAHRLAGGVDVVIDADGGILTVTMSVGAIQMTKDMTMDAAVNCADQALYRAKANGRARVELWRADCQAA